MTHILKLLSGDRGNPTSELDLNQLTAGEIRLTSGGLVPNPGQLNVLYTGDSIRYNGELPVKESRSNMRLELRYNISGGSSADISRIQREITQFLRDAKLYNQDGQGEAVWLEYRWNTSQALDDLPRPTWGQLNYYAEILSADDVRWPDNIHEQGYLNGNFVEGVICTLTCKPHWYGLEQRCITTPGLMDVTDQYNTTLSAGIDFSGQFVISGWFENTDNLSANNIALQYRIDASNYLYLYQATNGYIYLYRVVAGSSSSVSKLGNTSATNHFAIVQGASTITLYVNGSPATGTLSTHSWSAGVFYVGCQYSGSNKETTTTLDGWRIWEGVTLTAAQVAALYAEEKAIKDAGGWVGKPPYLYTYNATNKIYRGNSTNSGGYNCAIVGNVNGSGVDALIKTRLTNNLSTYGPLHTYIGRAVVSAPTIAGVGMYNITSPGTQTSSNDRYGNNYIQLTTWADDAGETETFYTNATDATVFNGRYTAIAPIRSDGENIYASFGYNPTRYNAGTFYLDRANVVDSIAFELVELGDIIIKKPVDGVPSTYVFELLLEQADLETTVAVDFVQLIPHPMIKITRDSGLTDAYYVDVDKTTCTFSSSEQFSCIGPAEGVTLEPNKHNVLMFQHSKFSDEIILDSTYIEISHLYVIPRWLLPGGLVA